VEQAAARQKILPLESLRGLAAVAVALHHLPVRTALTQSVPVGNAWLMVDLFFVLSGFVIALTYHDRIRDAGALAGFMGRRFLRLYPLHIVMLVVFVGLEATKLMATLHLGLVADRAPFTTNSPGELIEHLLLAHSLHDGRASWNGPSWSISAEFYTYLVFGLVALAARGRRTVLVATAVLLSAAGFTWCVRYGFAFDVLRCVYGFFLGVLAFAFWHARRPRLGSLAVAAVAVLVIAPLCVRRIWDFEWQALAFPPMFAVLVVALASCAPGPLRRVLEARPLVFLGTVSYGVYMIHYAMWWVLAQALRFAAQIRTVASEDGGTLLVLDSPLAQAAVTAGGLGLVIALAAASHRFLEVPAQRWRPRAYRKAAPTG
jgi:peptidoglycan/LPS O-acetylase OafA/YrhL